MENLKHLHRDILRELPDMLIFDIFWRLPMTDVVRTSVLSKRWRNFWTTAPFLNFDNRAMLFGDDKLRDFVNRALLCWNGNRILKFRFHSRKRNHFPSSMFTDVDLWVSSALRNGVEELHLEGKNVYCVPPCLYSCSSLKELSLHYCNLEIYGYVQWNKLESLTIKAYRVTADVINQILSGTPQLKVFNFKYYHRGGNLSIQSTSLKELSLYKFFWDSESEDLSVASELRICTPNLETLKINGLPYKKYLLTDVSSLTRAVLGSMHLGHISKVWSPNAFSQILPSIQHVENIELSYCCTKELGALKMKCANSAFQNVKSLELICCLYECKQVLGILEMFPQLERLVIDEIEEDCRLDETESLKFEENLPESFLLRLRTIEVSCWSKGYGIFPLIEIMLKYASKLEKFYFWLNATESSAASDSMFLVSQKLLGMWRSSTNCTFNIANLYSTPQPTN